jgi:glycosyltransferase involved in cell wall biosynthesis
MLGVIVLTILLKNLANYLSSVTSESLTRRLTCDLRRAGLDLLLGVAIDYHNTMRTGDIAKAALQQRVPVVFECHHHLDKRFEPEMATHPLLQAVVTVVDTVKESIVRSGMAEKKVVTIPNGFNGQFLARHPVAAQGWRDRLLTPVFTRLVVYAGALHEFKGVDLLLAIAPQFPQVKFSLAGGPGEQQRHYRQRIIDLGLENVELLGFLEQQDLAHLLQAADALAHPHGLGSAATFTSPLKLFDYLAAGTPVVATRIPSLDHWPLPAQSRPPPPRRSTVTLLPHSQAAQPPQVT